MPIDIFKADQRVQKLTKELEQLRSSHPHERYTAIVEMEILEVRRFDR